MDLERILQDITHSGVRKVLEKHNVTAHVFFKCLENDPIAARKYALALEQRTELIVDEILEIADTEPCPQTARNRIDARKWYSSKMNPRKYADRIAVDVAHTVDIRGALAEAAERRSLLRPRCALPEYTAQLVETNGVFTVNTPDCESVDVDPFS